jgi:predicted O-methyltransferase YrrM
MKWYLLNTLQRCEFARKNPQYALKAIFRDLTFADERFLAAATGTKPSEMRRFFGEPASAPDFLNHIRSSEQIFRGLAAGGADLYAKKVLIQYAVTRALKPEVVVETGVANGVSSAYLLLALLRNGKGTLHSIDIGDPVFLPAGQGPGWIVPDWLRSPWRLHIGDAVKLLPSLLQDLGTVDMFIHDSQHTYEHMKFELELAYPYVRGNGLLLADDAGWNLAFPDFARQVESPAAKIIRGVGVLRK